MRSSVPSLPRLAAVVLAAAPLLAACSGAPPGEADGPVPAPGPRDNVVLISLDTTRADALGCYGRPGAATPAIDRLASEGARLEHCVAPAPLTLPSHSSVMTGTDPFVHGVRYNGAFRLTDANHTLAEALHDAGYLTVAAIGSYVLNAEFGIAQGFDTYHDLPPDREERTAEEVADDAVGLLETAAAGDRPFFLFAHFFDPHAPYRAPAPFAGRNASPYLDEVSYTDAQVGRLLAEIDALGIADRTLVVLLGDHGESLGDHGEGTHSIFVYDATTSVPLLFRAPGRIPPGAVGGQARLIDVAPTVLAFVGAAPLPEAQGVSLVPRLLGRAPDPDAPAYSETMYPQIGFGYAPLRALRAGGWKYIHAPRPELYDLGADPGELHDLAAAEPERAARMRDELRRWIADAPAPPGEAAASPMTGEQQERLRSLGYVGGSTDALDGSGELARFDPAGPDPKDRLQVMTLTEQALEAKRDGDPAEAERLLRQALAAAPGQDAALRAVHETLADVLLTTGRYEEAIPHYRTTVDGGQMSAETPTNLGAALLKTGRVEEAAAVLARAVRATPVFASTHVNYGAALRRLGRNGEAVEQFRQALAMDPGSVEACLGLGASLAAEGRPVEAVAAYRDAVPHLSDPVPVLRALAELYVTGNRPEDALSVYADLAQRVPDDARVLQGQGLAYLQLERPQDAIRSLERSVELDPGSAHAWYALSAARAAVGRIDQALAAADRAAGAAEAAGDGEFARRIRARAAEYRRRPGGGG